MIQVPDNWMSYPETSSSPAARWPLTLLAHLYGLGVRLRNRAYRRLKGCSLPGFVVSIGNLTVGGTGKTPAACMLGQWAQGEGHRVAILSRGYGGKFKGKVLEVTDGSRVKTGPEEAGDEPYLMARKLQGIPVVISRKRYRAGMYAHKKFQSNFFILDDGFQHLSLKRDLDLVLLDASSPFGNGSLLPSGPLREPISELRRADALIITRSGPSGAVDALMEDLKERFPDKPIFRSDHIPEKVVFPSRRKTYSSAFLNAKRIIAFAGIARPEFFAETLAELGAELVLFKTYRDHHPYHPREIQDLMTEKRRCNADLVVTTEKDWVRMEGFTPKYPELAYLTVRFRVLDEAEGFFRYVKAKLRSRGVEHAERAGRG